MSEVSQSGRTILFVSHNMGAVQRLCPKTIVLNQGKLTYEGPTASAIDFYIRQSTKNAAVILLKDQIREKGGQQFRFTKVAFFVPNVESPILAATLGVPLKIAVHYTCKKEMLGQELDLSIAFSKISGDFLFACRSSATSKYLRLTKEEGIFYCHLPKNPLKKGRYIYNLIAFDRGKVVDHVVDAGQIEVNQGDYYGSGKVPASGRAGVCVDFEWKIGE